MKDYLFYQITPEQLKNELKITTEFCSDYIFLRYYSEKRGAKVGCKIKYNSDFIETGIMVECAMRAMIHWERKQLCRMEQKEKESRKQMHIERNKANVTKK